MAATLAGSALGRAEVLGQSMSPGRAPAARPNSRSLPQTVALLDRKRARNADSADAPCAEAVCGWSRRQVLTGAGALVSAFPWLGNGSALAEKAPKGYKAVLDNIDGYTFYYPFGWQEVAVKGQDVAFKDVIEPLESVSVAIVKTDKTKLEEIGSVDEVSKALVEKVLASPSQKTQLIEAKERSTDGRTYYTFEFIARAPNYTRHALGTVAISDGKFFTLTTGANERRWPKIQDKLRTVVDSFVTLK